MDKSPRIGLALSGGGFRAAAFGLGCLRALHDRDLLRHVRVISSISGGSIIAAMWAYGPTDFQDFDALATDLLRSGIQGRYISRVLHPGLMLRHARSVISPVGSPARERNHLDAMIGIFQAEGFGDRALQSVTQENLATIISASDTISAQAVRFGSELSSCEPYGKILNSVSVAEAVAASAAYPLLLPTMNRTYRFHRETGDGRTSMHSRFLAITDGGVYDNLGLSPLLPDSTDRYRYHRHDLDYLITADSSTGQQDKKPARIIVGRVRQALSITHTKNQDAIRQRVHRAAQFQEIKGVAHAYLGLADDRLPFPIPGLVPREKVARYGTNLSAMPQRDFLDITQRAEQLTRAQLAHSCPDLL